jgi:GTP cyclohydrolase II
MDMLAKNHSGLLLYLRQEGRGIGLVDKIRAYALQEQGMNTVEANIALGLEADHRNYDAAVDVLSTLGITKVKLITNNPHKMEALTEKGIEVVERVPIQVVPDQHTRGYLETKRDIFGHWLD